MSRKYGAFHFNTFVPCIILEIIGFLSFLIPYDNYSDRIAVTLSCLIVMACLFTTVSQNIPDFHEIT